MTTEKENINNFTHQLYVFKSFNNNIL